jgi:hypothetical protein
MNAKIFKQKINYVHEDFEKIFSQKVWMCEGSQHMQVQRLRELQSYSGIQSIDIS